MSQFQGRSTLLRRFTLLNAAIAATLAVGLSALTSELIQNFIIRDEAQVAAELVLRAAAPQLRPADFAGALPADRRALLDALFKAHGISDKIVRVRLWRADGALLYSNTPEAAVSRPASVDFAVSDGYRRFVVERGGTRDSTSGLGRFFVPVQVAGRAAPIAAFEIFYDLDLLQGRLADIRRVVWTAVPLGHLLAYASVVVLVGRASRRLARQQEALIAAHAGTLRALASAVDARDSYTGDHSSRVERMASDVARAMKLSEPMVQAASVTGRLHDIGKIAVPDAVLTKPTALSKEEEAIMRGHAEAGAAILKGAPFAENVKDAVRHVHERWDGLGYPEGLAGDLIPLLSRIVAVVDAYQAMTDNRPYRQRLGHADAINVLRGAAGTQFDPKVVDVFARLPYDPAV